MVDIWHQKDNLLPSVASSATRVACHRSCSWLKQHTCDAAKIKCFHRCCASRWNSHCGGGAAADWWIGVAGQHPWHHRSSQREGSAPDDGEYHQSSDRCCQLWWHHCVLFTSTWVCSSCWSWVSSLSHCCCSSTETRWACKLRCVHHLVGVRT